MPKIFQLNCRSLINKTDEINSFATENKIDFEALSETHFDNELSWFKIFIDISSLN